MNKELIFFIESLSKEQLSCTHTSYFIFEQWLQSNINKEIEIHVSVVRKNECSYNYFLEKLVANDEVDNTITNALRKGNNNFNTLQYNLGFGSNSSIYTKFFNTPEKANSFYNRVVSWASNEKYPAYHTIRAQYAMLLDKFKLEKLISHNTKNSNTHKI